VYKEDDTTDLYGHLTNSGFNEQTAAFQADNKPRLGGAEGKPTLAAAVSAEDGREFGGMEHLQRIAEGLPPALRGTRRSMEQFWRETGSIVGAVVAEGAKEVRAQQPLPHGIPKILGVDFQLDREGKPWLLEVNRFPSLGYRSEMEHRLKRAMLIATWNLIATSRTDRFTEVTAAYAAGGAR